MAKIETTVMSPLGEIMSLPGRIPAPEAFRAAREALQHEIDAAQLHLTEMNNWRVVAHRGSEKVRTHEEHEEFRAASH